MKIITIEALKTFLDELNKKYGTEFYSRKEIDEKLKELSKTSGYTQEKADAMMKEIARRIPNYQYEVKIIQNPHQTITATAGDKTYTDTFLIERGTKINFSVKPNTGYIPGSLSMKDVTVTKDMEVTATDAVENPELESGSIVRDARSSISIGVPPKVYVLELEFGDKKLYIKVTPSEMYNGVCSARQSFDKEDFTGDFMSVSTWLLDEIIFYHGDGQRTGVAFGSKSYSYNLTISWSKEINEHAYDYDLTAGNS